MHTYWTSMFWSIDSCQNRVPADQCHLTVSRAQVSTHRDQVFFEVMRWQVTSFQVIAGSSVVFMCRTIKILIANWPRTRKFSQLFTGREDSCFWLLTLYVQFLCSDWSKFNRWCSILNLVYFDIWSWQSFVSTFDVLTVFFHWMYKMKFSCYQESSVIHGIHG